MKNVRIKIGGTAMMVAMLIGAYRLGAPSSAPPASAPQGAHEEHQKGQGLTFQGDVAPWTVAIKPGKTAGFEKVLARVRDALRRSEKPKGKQQTAGGRVMKMEK